VVGAAIRAPATSRGLATGPVMLQWRETDVTAIARNFQREGMNILYPRIDWRGSGPGYVEMEFPIVSWLIAVGRTAAGNHEQIGRILSFCFGMITIVVFALLARALLPTTGALAATAYLTVNPLFVHLSTTIIPEPLMLLGSVTCAYAFWCWLRSDSWIWFSVAGGAGALAILAKAPAVHLGLLLLPLLLWKRGWRGLRDPRSWALATVMLAPAIAWYAHAHRFWLEYGNSIGISNEAHWTGLDAILRPDLLIGMLRAEVVQVWRGGAVLIALFAVIAAWRSPAVRYAVLWLAATYVYLAAVSRTTSQPWAYYYHIVAVPPAALLVGSGFTAALELRPGRRTPAATAVGMAVAAAVALATWLVTASGSALLAAAIGGSGAVLAALWWLHEASRVADPPLPPEARWKAVARRFDCVGLTAAAALTCAGVGVGLAGVLPAPPANELLACSQQFAPHVPPSALLLSSSYSCFDPDGQPQATNMPFFFYGMDRKGFNICQEAQSIAAVEAFAGRGAEFFAIDELSFDLEPDFGAALGERFELLARCNGNYLYAIDPPSDPR
jgi:4-amino-4-deoxy-L-arabinose transferase-like glycosyltransferase